MQLLKLVYGLQNIRSKSDPAMIFLNVLVAPGG